MKKLKIITLTNVLLLLSFLVTSISGIIMAIVFPAGQRTGQKIWLGLARHSWSSIHSWAGILMIVLTLAHVMFYWKVFVVMTKNMFKKEV
jgi:cytochrome b561